MDKQKNSNKKRREEQIARAKEKRESILKQIRKEKRVMLVTSIFGLFGAFLWIFAVATDYWYTVTLDHNDDLDLNSTTLNGKLFVSSHSGLFRSCRDVQKSTLQIESFCKYHTLFPNKEEIRRNPSLDEHVIDYTRTAITFAVISLLLMIMSLFSAFYTFKNARYMYKRLASGLYFITGACILIVQEVLVTLIRYEEGNVEFNVPPGAIVHYGFSFYMGWVVFLIYLVNGCVFMVFSRKLMMRDDDDDQNVFMGR